MGFGCGYSADRIQAARPRQHTIIECAEPVLVRLRAWAAERPSVVVVEGTWQATLPDLGKFDAIFFDDFGALPPLKLLAPNPSPPSTQTLTLTRRARPT